MLQLLLGLSVLGVTARYAGSGGRDRFLALSERRAHGVREYFTSRLVVWILVWGIAIAVVDIALAAYLRSWTYLGVSAAALVVFVVARALRARAAATVETAYAERGLEPLLKRESSDRRERRQKQLGVVLLGAYLAGRVLRVADERTAEAWPQALMGVTTLVMFAAGFALLWSTAWRFGDERPA